MISVKIERLISGNIESNGYVLWDESSKEGFIVDPGYNPDRFLQILEKNKIRLLGILLTHHHYDHVGGVEKIKETTGCKLYIHKDDADYLGFDADVILFGGETLLFGAEKIEVINSPGHTKGGLCLMITRHRKVFTGDSIFNVDLGRVDLQGGSMVDMKKSCQEIFNKWENDIVIYPGHGDEATMKYVRGVNQEFLDLL